MDNQKPLISVIIPTYKRPTYLKRAINSVKSQTYENIEIIVVDDNDADSEGRKLTEELMNEFSSDSQVKYIKHPNNINGAAARNTGFKNSSGEYIALLDDDDEFLPEKLESQLNCLQSKDETFGACYSNYVRVDEDGNLIDKCKENREGYLYCEALARNLFTQAGSNLLIKREMFEKINGFDESFERNQDIEFMSRLFMHCQVAYCDTLGLKIYINSVGKKSIDFVELTQKHKEKFKSTIDKLERKRQKEIYRMLDLQVARYIFYNKRNLKQAIAFIFKRKINLFLLLRYVFHLFRRKTTKTVYGFKL